MQNERTSKWRTGDDGRTTANDKARELRAVALRLNLIAAEVETNTALAAGLPVIKEPLGPLPDQPLGRDKLAEVARSIYQSRRRRYRWFNKSLFGEAAWDILLDAYYHKIKNKPLATTSACTASGVPHTTALRWIRILETAGLLCRMPHLEDKRTILIELTENGYNSMTCYLFEGHKLGIIPPPAI